MRCRLTVTLPEDVCRALHAQAGRGNVSRSVEGLVRAHLVLDEDLEAAYREMAADAAREREALERSTGTHDGVADTGMECG
jgi:hypothetical protein